MRVHAWGVDNPEKAVWFFIADGAEGYVVRYEVRPQPFKIVFYGPIDHDLAEGIVLGWTGEVEGAGLKVGWAFYTAEIDEDVFVAALDAVKQWGNADLLDAVLYKLFDGDVVQINEPRNSSVVIKR